MKSVKHEGRCNNASYINVVDLTVMVSTKREFLSAECLMYCCLQHRTASREYRVSTAELKWRYFTWKYFPFQAIL